MSKAINYIIYIVLILVALIITSASKYYVNVYGNSNLDGILFYLNSGLEGADLSVVYEFFKEQWYLLLLSLVVILLPVFSINKNKYFIEMDFKNKKVKLNFFPIFHTNKMKLAYVLVILLGSIGFSYQTLGVNDFLKSLTDYSTFIEEEYVNPNDVQISFPENKRNLIMIYLESMETTMLSKENGGGWNYSVMPELEKLAVENTNFSNTESIGGSYNTPGTNWTIAGLVSTTSGLPLKLPIGGNDYTDENFLTGAIALGDILKNEGYNLEFMFGSDAKFGGRYQYFMTHGGHNIFDLNTAIDRKLMTPEDVVFWGFEDNDLFEWAKQEISILSKEDKPFNLNMLTVNTHFTDGWLESGAEEIHPTQYENVHAHTSKQVSEFINWLQEQDFYENTTVVLVGDHLSMQPTQYYEENIADDKFERVIYNSFLNSPVQPVKEKERLFSNLDIYPTVLASLGVEIEGNRLALGTNLYSSEETLYEKYGIKHVNGELSKNSSFYNARFLGDEYVDLIKPAND
ncbi:LTA synthase family protein [Bacillus sp. BGMRC 2118]|nr:LTA synthase family protein [Bacillus sp. BGMRC 2118]